MRPVVLAVPVPVEVEVVLLVASRLWACVRAPWWRMLPGPPWRLRLAASRFETRVGTGSARNRKAVASGEGSEWVGWHVL